MPPSVMPSRLPTRARTRGRRATAAQLGGPVRIALQGAAAAMVGGQAVMEGVMMRTPHHWAVAIRRVDGRITLVERDITPFAERHRWGRLPVLRGIVALGESLGIGFRALNLSARYAAEWYDEPRDEAEDGEAAPADAAAGETVVEAAASDSADGVASTTPESDEREVADGAALASDEDEAAPELISGWHIALSFIMAIGIAVGLFKLLPLALTKSFVVGEQQTLLFVLAEGAIRISVFCAYLALVGLLPDLKRVFQYHSAEHKSINGFEHGIALEPTAVNDQSRIHVRCGTAFLLWVFVVAILVFGIYGWVREDPSLIELVASRIVFLPLIAGVSFELIRWAGKHPDNRLIRGVLAPGLWLQYLTTRECTPEQCEVAILSLESVLERERVTSGDKWQEPAVGGDDAVEVMA